MNEPDAEKIQKGVDLINEVFKLNNIPLLEGALAMALMVKQIEVDRGLVFDLDFEVKPHLELVKDEVKQ